MPAGMVHCAHRYCLNLCRGSAVPDPICPLLRALGRRHYCSYKLQCFSRHGGSMSKLSRGFSKPTTEDRVRRAALPRRASPTVPYCNNVAAKTKCTPLGTANACLSCARCPLPQPSQAAACPSQSSQSSQKTAETAKTAKTAMHLSRYHTHIVKATSSIPDLAVFAVPHGSGRVPRANVPPTQAARRRLDNPPRTT
jgi:hypothetical protein